MVLNLPNVVTLNTVLHVVVTHNMKIKLFSLLLPNCNFTTVINRTVDIFRGRGLPKGHNQQVQNLF